MTDGSYSALAANGFLPPAQAGALLDLLVMVRARLK